jgi:hypothetical protein
VFINGKYYHLTLNILGLDELTDRLVTNLDHVD